MDKVVIPKTVNPDLVKERKNCTFAVEEFSEWWVGGAEKLKERREREKFFLDDPELVDEVPAIYLSHKEVYENNMKKATIIMRKIKEYQGKNEVDNQSMAAFGGLLSSAFSPQGNPMAVHFAMFLPTIVGQATPEQQSEWLGRAWRGEILGTYAQTELGHGTFIRGLECTSTYDPKTEEFVLNSPTLTSYKWWPGGLGHTANYTVVVAQLYTSGKCYGIHPFIVQIRDENTHKPMKGVHVGEVGNKIGYNGVNNGFLGFKNVRIPRKNMLMKNAQVLADGTYVKAKSSLLTYGTMVFVRVVIVQDMAHNLSKAVTIATRYSAVRRQSPINPNDPEPQIIDHLTQQYKIFPYLAKVIVFRMAADDLWQQYLEVTSELNQGNLGRLPEFHALSCCLKAVSTADASAGIETCRLACGGHGFLSSSSFTALYGMVTAAVTYEGENTVLYLQTARYLMKSWASALKGEPLTPTVAYLGYAQKYSEPGQWDSSMTGIINGLQMVAAGRVRLAYETLQARKKGGMTHEEASNRTGIELVQAAESHCRAFLVQSGYEMCQKNIAKMSPALGAILQEIVELYAVEACIKASGDLLRFTRMTGDDLTELQYRLENILQKIRKNAVGIVDGFDIRDRILNSTLGAYDGNVYERLFTEALKSPLNQEPVNISFHKYLKPAMQKSKL